MMIRSAHSQPTSIVSTIAVCVASLCWQPDARAAEPQRGTTAGVDSQFLGASRDNRSRATGLLKQWPAAGPPLAWAAALPPLP